MFGRSRARYWDPFRVEAVFVHEIEGETSVEESCVDSMGGFVHVVRARGSGGSRDTEAACSVL